MSDLLPCKTGDRLFVAWLVFLTLLAVATSEWNAAMGWSAAALGWYVAVIEGDQVDLLLLLHREQHSP